MIWQFNIVTGEPFGQYMLENNVKSGGTRKSINEYFLFILRSLKALFELSINENLGFAPIASKTNKKTKKLYLIWFESTKTIMVDGNK